jgi:hypothetical protein
MFLSFSSEKKSVLNMDRLKEHHGILKNKKWIYNTLDEGTYRFL